ncbi:hypothetical protein EJ05DRAFT_105309 [Pseudovirgaria hyperparasitica]|uniref:DEUBAD domain-containing protein n=1 Tax=Pseudovirgaria hyperparasitica TaxID=470096 RepID=A0A6A6W1V4_9PEZI|nr:uncharacterized protein EJ05DRAFT_105309 [Pseudovirgaria hyperparasitica]KAF2755557.1 hypothetical protein EJ05DRAFT_105309 [Pseudovirgaria hyperparasitica]
MDSSPLSSARSDISTPSSGRSVQSLEHVDPIKSHQDDNHTEHQTTTDAAEDHTTAEDSVPPVAVSTSTDTAPSDSYNDHIPKDHDDASLDPVSNALPDEVQQSPIRPKRKRKSPVRYEEPLEQGSPPKKAKNTPSRTQSRRLPRGAKEPNYSPDFVTTSPKSVLVNLDLDMLFSDERTWASLSREAQERLFKILPNGPPADSFPADEPLPNLPKQLLRQSQAFRTDLRLFQEDLGAGRLDPQWRREAAEAMEERASGRFDVWKYEEREEYWGQKMKGTNDS